MADIDMDLIWMSLLLFLPSAFALVLLFFPKGTDEYMRWWTLLGTAVTFVVSAIVFIQYLGMLDGHRDEDAAKIGHNRPSFKSSLAERAAALDMARVQDKAVKSNDGVA